jgi:hypothetical protein
LSSQVTTPGIFDLSTHKVFPVGMSPHRRVSSYLAISPLPRRTKSDVTGRYLFCGTVCLYGVQPQSLPVRKYGALSCPDFPPICVTSDETGDRTGCCSAKVRHFQTAIHFTSCPPLSAQKQAGRNRFPFGKHLFQPDPTLLLNKI